MNLEIESYVEDKIVLDYNDALVYESDLKLLNQGKWLNDRIIGFWYEYLEKDLFKDQKSLGFVNPCTVQYLKLINSLSEARMCFLDPLELNKKDYVFFPLNNNKEMDKAGGCHWSLLVANNKDFSLIHYDSIAGGSNESEAKLFYEKYKSVFKWTKLSNCNDFPQQGNSYDCGVFLCAATEIIANMVTNKSSVNYKSITPENVLQLRNRIKMIIHDLALK